MEHLDSIDVQKEVFEEVEILGCYALRQGYDDSYPATLENGVGVNYFGSVLLTEEIELDEREMKFP